MTICLRSLSTQLGQKSAPFLDALLFVLGWFKAADQAANAYGRGWGGNTSLPCEVACMPYRPNGLPPQYWTPMTRKKTIIVLLALIVLAGVGVWLKHYLDIDRCLDNGGR